jgi:coenzyme PQQ precursor peptide PqqA
MMTPSQLSNVQTEPTLHEGEPPAEGVEPRPWTAPQFVERSTCAEIGAYAYRDD